MIFQPHRLVLLLFCSLMSMNGYAASVVKDGKAAFPDDMYCEFKPLPADENAIIEWKKAEPSRVTLSSHENEIITYCWKPGAPRPSADDREDLQGWLRRNQAALDAFAASLKKPGAQWPERNPQNRQPEMSFFSQLLKGRLVEADQLAEQGRFPEATQFLEDSLKLAQLGIKGDGQTIQYAIAGNSRDLIQGAILTLASRKRMPLDLMKRLLHDLPPLDSETNIYHRVLQFEYMSEAQNTWDLKKVSEIYSRMSETNILMMFYPDDCQRPLRVLLDPNLVAWHPKPLDMDQELAIDREHYRIYWTNSFSPWSNRVDIKGEEQDAIRTNLLAEIAPMMEVVQNDPLPLSRQAAQKIRDAYLKIQNPVGRILDCSTIAILVDDSRFFKFQAERNITRTLLALLIFEREKGVLPAKLSDLVEAKILDAVPVDPFATAPLSYSREKHIVWSVGLDGDDDDGTAGESHWTGLDAVWQIPELN